MVNRLQFKHDPKIYANQEEIMKVLTPNAKWGEGNQALLGEPVVFRYGTKESPNILLAIGSVGNGTSDDDNQYFIIDTADLQSSINNINKQLILDDEHINENRKNINTLKSGLTQEINERKKLATDLETEKTARKQADDDLKLKKISYSDLTMYYDSDRTKIVLSGANDYVQEIDADIFVKDGLIKYVDIVDDVRNPDGTKNEEKSKDGPFLKIVWNADADEDELEHPNVTYVPLIKLVNVYTVSGGSESYIHIDEYVVGLNVDNSNGLASVEYVTDKNKEVNDKIDSVNSALSQEIKENFEYLDGKIDGVEDRLQHNIDFVYSSLTNTINEDKAELQHNIDVTNSALTKEENARIEADTLLQENIDKTNSALTLETEERKTNDNVLNSAITENKQSIATLENEKISYEDLTLVYDNNDGNHIIYLYGKDKRVLSSFSADEFVNDGMLKDVEFLPGGYNDGDGVRHEGAFIRLEWNTDAGDKLMHIPLTDLIDIYTVSGGSETYIHIYDYKIGLNVDESNGLASVKYVSGKTKEVNDKIDAVNSALTQESAIRKNNDDVLQGEVDVLTSAITIEVKTRSQETSELTKRLDELTVIVSGNSKEIEDIEDDLDEIPVYDLTKKDDYTYSFTKDGVLKTEIIIPKDKVVTSGSVIVKDGKSYISLTIDNSNGETIDIDVSDLVDSYTINSGSSEYIKLVNKEFSLNVDNSNGLASYSALTVVSNEVKSALTNNDLKLEYANGNITLYGKDGSTISSFSAADFVKDGMIDTVEVVNDPSFDDQEHKGAYLCITWNTDAGKEKTFINLFSLLNVYTVAKNSQQYLVIEDYVLSANVDCTDGLASYYALHLLEDKLDTIAGTGFENTTLTYVIEAMSGNVVDIIDRLDRMGITDLINTLRVIQDDIAKNTSDIEELSGSTEIAISNINIIDKRSKETIEGFNTLVTNTIPEIKKELEEHINEYEFLEKRVCILEDEENGLIVVDTYSSLTNADYWKERGSDLYKGLTVTVTEDNGIYILTNPNDVEDEKSWTKASGNGGLIVVDAFSSLTSEDFWVENRLDLYDGLTVTVKEDSTIYILTDAENYTDPDVWIKTSGNYDDLTTDDVTTFVTNPEDTAVTLNLTEVIADLYERIAFLENKLKNGYVGIKIGENSKDDLSITPVDEYEDDGVTPTGFKIAEIDLTGINKQPFT